MSEPISVPTSSEVSTYTPGYSLRKRLLLAGGLLLFVFGFSQLWHPLRLLAFGARAKAEAFQVVKEKPGLPPLVLVDDPQVAANLEVRDRSYTFWNDFRFQTAEGREVVVRANVGGQLKPLYALRDADGLPTTDLVAYDPRRPEDAVFPLIISTWIAPAFLCLVGLLGAAVGAVLWYWSDKPIEMPKIQAAKNALADADGEKKED